MANVKISELPSPSTAALADVLIANQGGTTKRPTVGGIGAAVAGMTPTQLTYTTAIPLLVAGAHMIAHTIAGATTFTVASNPVDGASCMLKLTADGTNTPNFSAFIKVGSASWVNTTGIVNIVQFFRLSGTAYYSVAQAAA